jgi:hypothetical protein
MKTIIAANGETLIFDEKEYEIANKYKWFVYKDKKGHKTIYTLINLRKYYLPQLIFNIEQGKALFRKNGNICDFSKENLIILSRSEYGHITAIRENKASKYIGVHKKKKRWAVKILKDRQAYYKTSYIYEDEAGIVSDYIIMKLYGITAKRNFPELTYEEIKELYENIQNSYGKSLEL